MLKKCFTIALATAFLLASGCSWSVKYSLSGASIPLDAKTFSVAYFPNNAPMVNPTLSSVLTEALVDKFLRQTKLEQVDEGGDFAFEGEITNYQSMSSSISGTTETALTTRLTITVNVRFTNEIVPEGSFSQGKSFSAFEDFDSSTLTLTDVEGELVPLIVDKIVNEIFLAAAAQW
jgi:hypothetical protein